MQMIHSANPVSMSSREIADLTGAGHDNVLKTLRALVSRGVVSGNETPYTHPQNGQTYTEIMLNYRDTMVVVSGYSVELRAKIIDRWQELESRQAVTVPTTLSAALRLAADQAEQIEQQAQQLAIAAPKVEFVDRFVVASGLYGFRQVAKMLAAKENELSQWLIDSGIMYRLAGKLTPCAAHLNTGRFEVKAGASDAGHAFTQAKFTAKGFEWIAGKWAVRQLEEAA